MDLDPPPVSNASSPAPESYYRVEFHPACGKPPRTFPLDSQPLSPDTEQAYAYSGPNPPWEPFPTRADFDFAEFSSTHGLSNSQINDLLTRLRGVWASNVHITMRNATDVRNGWDHAASIFPKVS